MKRSIKTSDVHAKAKKAIASAVAETLNDHAKTGDPVVVWRDGKVTEVRPKVSRLREKKSSYRSKKRS